ncbi:MAG TPA: TetR/AcrR family transcriptional regulator [Candidatus Polarisedimenticolaceae bacterium]|nr:TetR/AcrR family transcriptional regulator [Candidatus Polarisedimenticolaceae bacterium]
MPQQPTSETQPTRERLLDAAARLFHERGFEATPVAAILERAGVHSGSLYHYFPGKDALLRGVLERYRGLLQPVVLGPIEEAERDPIERVFRLLDWYRQGMTTSRCRRGCPIGNLALEVSDTHPEVRPIIAQNLAAWAAGIERWLDEAADRLPADCDRQALAGFVLTVMEGGLLEARALGDLAPFDRSVAVLRDHVNRLLADAAGRPAGAQEDRR